MFLNSLKNQLSTFKLFNQPLIITKAAKDLQILSACLAFTECSYNKDSIIICTSLEKAEHVFNIAKNTLKINNVYLFPDFDVPPYSKSRSSNLINTQRINTLYALLNEKAPRLVITTALGFLFKTPTKNYLQNKQLKLFVNQTIDHKEVIKFLTDFGYTKVETVTSNNTFGVRGDILDIYAANELPFRISFFDNVIESIKTFNPESQRTINTISHIYLQLPAEIIISEETIKNFKYNYQLKFGSFKKNDINLEALNSNVLPFGAEHYLPLFFEEASFISDHLNDPRIIILDDFTGSIKNIYEDYQTAYALRSKEDELKIAAFKENGTYYVLPPNELLLTEEKALNFIKSNTKGFISVNETSLPPSENTALLNLESKPSELLFNKTDPLTKKYEAIVTSITKNPNFTFIINIVNENLRRGLETTLNSAKIKYHKITTINQVINGEVNLLEETYLQSGFTFENTIVICETDILSLAKSPVKKRKTSASNAFSSLSHLTKNQLVAHVKHGIGRFKELTTLTLNNGFSHDFLLIEYKDQDKLYLPVENIDLLGKYSHHGENVQLDKLGSSSWEKKQAKAKEKIKDIAYDLIKLAANRALNNGIYIDTNQDAYLDFSTKFPYIETEEQLAAIKDIEEDFKKEKVMDRLVCGDVGFGKTEVAMRAAFMVANAGYQVAIITPTTLLCRQHYYNFIERFKGFEINIKQLSKFVSPKNKKVIKADLANGKVGIVIGTHALLAKDIKFKNLALLIIDEEQNFGVVHKEKLKALKENIHVLTLTATPIPRTLQLSLNKVKDLSLITTPPLQKLAIHTYVMPYDPLAIKEAIDREIKRNGQIFYVTPHIKDLTVIEQSLHHLNPNLRVLTVHGGLPADQIEKGMEAFQNHKFDVLLSTSIIESGIDISNVNTIIINNADKFGLSQLYQLRGRVGRGKVQAFAYITYKSHLLLSGNAEKRLIAIQNLDYLGAGFSLAEHDLDIRGAGNILGEEQSGHLKEIGFDLYQKFLAVEIDKAKNKSGDSFNYESLSPNIQLGIPALMPSYYIPDISTRMYFYDKLGNCYNTVLLSEITDELIDRFGKIPTAALNLITTIKLKILCKQLGIEKITAGNKGALIYFYHNKVSNLEGLLKYIEKTNSSLKLKPDSSLLLSFMSEDKENQIKQLFTLLTELKHSLLNK